MQLAIWFVFKFNFFKLGNPLNCVQSFTLFSDKSICSKLTACISGKTWILFVFKFNNCKYWNLSGLLKTSISFISFTLASILII